MPFFHLSSSSSLLVVLYFFSLSFFLYHPLPLIPSLSRQRSCPCTVGLVYVCLFHLPSALLHTFTSLSSSLFVVYLPHSHVHATSEQYEVVQNHQLEHALLLSLSFYPLSLVSSFIFSWFSFVFFFSLFSLFSFSHTKQASNQVNIHQASWPSNVTVWSFTQAGWFGFNLNGYLVVWYDLTILHLVCKQNNKQKTRNKRLTSILPLSHTLPLHLFFPLSPLSSYLSFLQGQASSQPAAYNGFIVEQLCAQQDANYQAPKQQVPECIEFLRYPPPSLPPTSLPNI